MQSDALPRIDSTTVADTTIRPLVVSPASSPPTRQPLQAFIQVPVWQDTVEFKSVTAVYPPRHDGLLRPVSAISETFLLVLLLILVFFMNRVVRNSSHILPEIIKNMLFLDEHSFTHATLSKRNLTFLWPLNIMLVSLAAKVYLQKNGYETDMDSWLFWKIAFFTSLFLVLKHLLFKLIAGVFFSPVTMRRWSMGNLFIFSFFSISLIPLLLLHEIGVIIPFSFYYLWPVLFLIMPKVAYSIKGLNFFLIEKGGYFYTFLYLCTLEILPLLLYLKGIFLIQS